MVELNEKALEAAHDAFYATESSNSLDMMRNAIIVYFAALPAPDDGLEVVAWAQDAALGELAKHKDATATIASGLLLTPFGSPVALVRLSDAQVALQSRGETIARLTAERDEYRNERDNLSTIVATEIDSVAGAELDDLQDRAEAAEARLARAMKVVERIAKATVNTTFGPWPCGGAKIAREFLEDGE